MANEIASTTIIYISLMIVVASTTIIFNQITQESINDIQPRVQELKSVTGTQIEIINTQYNNVVTPNILIINAKNTGTQKIMLDELLVYIDNNKITIKTITIEQDTIRTKTDVWEPGEIIRIEILGIISLGTREIKLQTSTGIITTQRIFIQSDSPFGSPIITPPTPTCNITLSGFNSTLQGNSQTYLSQYNWNLLLANQFTFQIQKNNNIICSTQETNTEGVNSLNCQINFPQIGSQTITTRGIYQNQIICSDEIILEVEIDPNNPLTCQIQQTPISLFEQAQIELSGPSESDCFIDFGDDTNLTSTCEPKLITKNYQQTGTYEIFFGFENLTNTVSCSQIEVICPTNFLEENNQCIYDGPILFGSGLNDFGQVGINTVSNSDIRITQTQIQNSPNIVKLYAGTNEYACAITAEQDTYCWGHAFQGRLGTGQGTGTQSTPTKVQGNHLFETLGLGRSTTCAINNQNELYCWGSGSLIPLQTNPGNILTPLLVNNTNNWTGTDLNQYAGCALDSLGDAYCWGSRFRTSTGLQSTSQDVRIPTKQNTNLKYQKIKLNSKIGTTNYEIGCALTTNDEIACWGDNTDGKLGRNTFATLSSEDRRTPTLVTTTQEFKYLSTGAGHVCAINMADDAYCWGKNTEGQLGDGTFTSKAVPTKVDTTLKFKQISAGEDYTCAVTLDSQVYCWGAIGDGRAGETFAQNEYNQPIQINTTNPIKEVSIIDQTTHLLVDWMP